MKLFTKIQSYPIVLYQSEEPTYVSEIDFPAVTICPEILTVIEDLNFDDIIVSLQNGSMSTSDLSEKELKFIQVVGMVVNDEFVLSLNLTIDTSDIYAYLDAIFRKFSKVPYNTEIINNAGGTWIRKNNLLFSITITSFGYCYTYNNPNFEDMYNADNVPRLFNTSRDLHVSELDLYRYSYTNPNLTYPVRTNNFRFGFQMVYFKKIPYEKNFTYEPTHENYVYKGMQLIIHDSYEFPSERLYTTIAPTNKSMIFFISPSMSVYDEELSQYSADEYVKILYVGVLINNISGGVAILRVSAL